MEVAQRFVVIPNLLHPGIDLLVLVAVKVDSFNLNNNFSFIRHGAIDLGAF